MRKHRFYITKDSNRMNDGLRDKIINIQKKQKEKNDYVVEEAEEEEDEFFGLGGPDVEETEDLDRYEQDGVLVEHNEETENLDDAALRAIEQDAESDRNMVQRLLKDITSGGLRKRKAALEEGFMFDDIDIYDDDDDLVAVRRAAAAKRRKMLQDNGGALEALAQNPKTAAFVRAARARRDEGAIPLLDDSEGEEEKSESEEKSLGKSLNAYLIDEEDDGDDDGEDEDVRVDYDETKKVLNTSEEIEIKHPVHNNEAKVAHKTNGDTKRAIHLTDDEDDDNIPYTFA
ncbi:hypothetical protein G6F43_000225 [Rhizopus delemar]|nr:hypothetical protein G6F43_000225 [Rhizopus delemar]